MKAKIAAWAMTGLLVANPLWAAEQTVTFDIPGMYCASCPFIVEAAMGAVQGVVSVTADSSTRTAVVVYDDEITTLDAIETASAEAGYDAFPVE